MSQPKIFYFRQVQKKNPDSHTKLSIKHASKMVQKSNQAPKWVKRAKMTRHARVIILSSNQFRKCLLKCFPVLSDNLFLTYLKHHLYLY